MNTGRTNKIVVGFDGSFASHAALRWAIARAARDNASVTAVEVGRRPRPAPGTSHAIQPYGMAPPHRARHSRFRAARRRGRGSWLHPDHTTGRRVAC